MEQATTKVFTKWDHALNEIYGVFDEELATSKMDQLREEQRDWVKHRDEVAKKEFSQYKGGSLESLEYIATQQE